MDASSSSPWGHINVDEIDLSWESRGGLHPERWAKCSPVLDGIPRTPPSTM